MKQPNYRSERVGLGFVFDSMSYVKYPQLPKMLLNPNFSFPQLPLDSPQP